MGTNDAAISRGPGTGLKLWLVGVPVFIALAVMGIAWAHARKQVGGLERQLENEKARADKLSAVDAQRAEYDRLIKRLEVRIDSIYYLQKNRIGPADLLRDAQKLTTLTPDVDLLSFEFTYEGWLFKGRAHSVDAAAKFLTAVPSVAHFSQVQLQNFYQDKTCTPPTYYFEFVCTYTPPQLPEEQDK